MPILQCKLMDIKLMLTCGTNFAHFTQSICHLAQFDSQCHYFQTIKFICLFRVNKRSALNQLDRLNTALCTKLLSVPRPLARLDRIRGIKLRTPQRKYTCRQIPMKEFRIDFADRYHRYHLHGESPLFVPCTTPLPLDFDVSLHENSPIVYLRTIFQGILKMQLLYTHVCQGMTKLFTQQHPINFNTTYICVCQ